MNEYEVIRTVAEITTLTAHSVRSYLVELILAEDLQEFEQYLNQAISQREAVLEWLTPESNISKVGNLYDELKKYTPQ